MKRLLLRICGACEDASVDLSALRDALEIKGLGEKVQVETSACLGPCGEPVAMTLQASAATSYVFAGVAPADDAQDIAATCAAYLDSEDGWIEDARGCGRLRFCLKARTPV